MELRQLKYFAKVAELSNFSEAAKALNITQSTLSQQIKSLENELDAELLIRDSHHVRLTDVGQAFLPQALKTLLEADTSLDHIRKIKGVVSGSLTIGTTYTFSPILNEVLLAFVRKYPGVKVNVCCHPVEELMSMLSSQQVDIVFSYRSSEQYGDIESNMLFDNRLSAVMSDTHPLDSRSPLTLSELSRCKLVLPAEGMQARSVFDAMAGSRRADLHVQMEVNDIGMLLGLVRSSHMVTVLSQATVRRGEGLVAVPIADECCRMDGCYHIKKGAYMKYAAKEFVSMVEEFKSLSIRKMDIG